jgi:hypothetical protein
MTEMTGISPFIYSNFLTSKKLKTVSCQSFLSSSGGAVVAPGAVSRSRYYGLFRIYLKESNGTTTWKIGLKREFVI